MNFKHFLLHLIVFMIFSALLSAQTEQGVFRLGGDIAFDQYKTVIEIPIIDETDEYSSSRLMIQLKPGYFIAQQVLVGADLGITTVSFDDETNGTEFLIGPHLSYYIKSGNSDLFFPVTLFGGYVSQTFDDFLDPDEQDVSSGIYYGGSIGLEYIPGDNIGININFGPQFRNFKQETAGFEFNENITNWQVRFGVNYYFTKNKEEE